MRRNNQFPSVLSNLSELNRFFDQFMGAGWDKNDSSLMEMNWSPTIDVKEDKNQYIIEADIPGVDPDDIEIDMEQGRLTIKGHKEAEKKETKDDYVHIERSHGSFARSVHLANAAESSKIQAKMKNGVLKITVPKTSNAENKKIKIQAE